MRFYVPILALLLVLLCLPAPGQTTAFNYQGRLTDGGNPANGSFQMQFKLFDSLAGGLQIGSTLTDVAVTASNGTFSARLDFGAAALTGANRFLEIAVRHNSGESYITLSPREQIGSSPYSVRTLSAAVADDSQKLGGVVASEYLTNTSAGTQFIRNQAAQQASSNFNISGNGAVGGNLGVGTQAPTSKLDVRGNLTLDSGASPTLYTGTAGAEQNRFLQLINSFTSPSASGLKAGGILVGDSYGYANPGKNDLIVKGSIAVGTPSPTGGYRLDVAGPVQSAGDSTHFVAQTTGGTNSWARFYMRSSSQSWLMGTSQNFNGNQFYIVDETFGRTRMSIEPNAGPIRFDGNLSQPLEYKGLPKMLLQIGADGALLSCQSGITGAPCVGVTSSRLLTGTYRVDVGFPLLGPHIMITPRQAGRIPSHTASSGNTFDITQTEGTNILRDGPMSIVIF
ncbi:MAG TPA: hypothetical protein VMZ26_15335 [Pyrinomonadaceae bacterium]|nr:hypothetical protein [Pyrinomonadaceae bacterium]